MSEKSSNTKERVPHCFGISPILVQGRTLNKVIYFQALTLNIVNELQANHLDDVIFVYAGLAIGSVVNAICLFVHKLEMLLDDQLLE